jgi:transcriptional repressor NF-X1
VKCVRAWAEKSFNDVKEAWRARGEVDKSGEWRCPGCQGRRGDIGITYR